MDLTNFDKSVTILEMYVIPILISGIDSSPVTIIAKYMRRT